MAGPRPRIIVTRPEPDGSAFARLVREAGFEPVLAPAMTIEGTDAPPALEGVGALAFTSANGVRALGVAPLLPAFAVGAATAAAAREAGFAEVFVADGDVAALAALIAARRDRVRGAVLHIAGSDRAGDLKALLKASGVEARRAVLYAARPASDLGAPARDALLSGGGGAALFSPRTARIFLDLVRAAGLEARLETLRAFCLSAAVAEAAGAERWAAIDIAAEATADALIVVMKRAFTFPGERS